MIQTGEERLVHPHFHSTQKGCDLREEDQASTDPAKDKPIRGMHCETHILDICHCGWEWQWHTGEDLSTYYRKYERIPDKLV